MKGKTVIITGGSRGIGSSCVKAFVRAGARVAFTYHKNAQEAEKVQREIGRKEGKVLSIQADVRDYQRCRAVVETVLREFKKIDVLVNNAGITRDRALMMMTVDDWKEVIETNLGGVFNMTRAAITTFLKQKSGCIINMSSVSGLTGLPRQSNYSASKAGIIGFTKALAKEVSAYGIRVNAVCPGFISTDMVSAIPEKVKQELLKAIPMGRVGIPEEVAELCVFLASDKAAYITGEVIKIDGGLAI